MRRYQDPTDALNPYMQAHWRWGLVNAINVLGAILFIVGLAGGKPWFVLGIPIILGASVAGLIMVGNARRKFYQDQQAARGLPRA
jgi:hypothetical protein